MEELKIEILDEIVQSVQSDSGKVLQRIAEVALDEECSNCEHYDPCHFCDGIGYIPTEAGKILLEFFKRYKIYM